MTENTNELSFKKRGDQDSAGTNQCTGLESDAAWNLAPPPTPWLWAHRRSSQPGSPSEGGFSSNLSQKLLGILTEWMYAAHLEEYVPCDSCFTKVTSIPRS